MTEAFQPWPGPQEDFVSCPAFEAMLGGGRGRGGTFALGLDAVRHTPEPRFRGLFLRRTVPELRELIDICWRIFPAADPGAEYNRTEHIWKFTSGARIECASLERHDDWRKFQGRAFQWIGFDELTHWEREDTYLNIFGSLRCPDNFMEVYVRSTANPGGPGNSWCRKRFVDPAPPGTYVFDVKTKKYRVYFHGTYKDNKALADSDYGGTLDTMSDKAVKMFKYGRWDTVEGQEFEEWNPELHVIRPHKVPQGARVYRSGDYGYSSASSILWWYVDQDDNLTCCDELYVSGYDVERLALEIKKRDDKYGGNLDGPLDSQCWAQGGYGTSIADVMHRHGVRWRKAVKDRYNGMMELHRRLSTVREVRRGDEVIKVPAIRFFNTCRNVISVLPSMQSDGSGQDVKEGGDDHAYDCARYSCMYRPMRLSASTPVYDKDGSYSHLEQEDTGYRNSVTGY